MRCEKHSLPTPKGIIKMEKQTTGVQSVERTFKLIELLSAKKEMSIKRREVKDTK